MKKIINILDFDISDLKKWMKENDEKEFRAKQVMDWLYKGIEEFDDIKNLPSSLISKLKDEFYIGLPSVVKKYASSDTIKFLLEYKDRNVIESVLMKYNYGYSICVSTQIGCRMGCRFCASTTSGIVRNLSNGEIMGEILRVQKEVGVRISNVVLMGSGEPFDNFENVMKFIDMVTSSYTLNIGQRHITISTCGIVPKIIKFADKRLQVTLAISLHAPDDDIRCKLMPISNKYTIREIIDACRYYIDKTNKRVTFEYALIDNINDRKCDAEKLCSLIKGLLCHVNLIPINSIKESNFKKSSKNSVLNFKKILENNHIDVTIRREMGTDINAACGQLRKSYIEKYKYE